MAKVKNITGDTLSLFRADAPPVRPGDEVTIRDENFVERAWPKSTWKVVERPKLDGYVDLSNDDAYLWAAPEPGDFDPGEHSVEEVLAHLSISDEDERSRVAVAELAGKARKTITEWSDR